MSSNMWQHPFVNIFKHYNISTWKKITKGGDVTSKTDKQLKCTIHDIRGSVPASNFIQLPALASQSLCLTGRYFYLLFRPHPSRHFVFHIDVATSDGLSVRLSFSNIYREYKCSSTWIQFPYICTGGHGTIHGLTEAGVTNPGSGPAPLSSRWTVLCLDLSEILTIYVSRRYAHVRGMQLCANLSVKTALTSDQEYCPGVSLVEARGSGVLPLPREAGFLLKSGERWEDHYDFLRFPASGAQSRGPPFDSVHARTSIQSLLSAGERRQAQGRAEAAPDVPEVAQAREVSLERPLQSRLSMIQSLTSPRDGGSGLASAPLRLPPPSLPTADDLPLVNVPPPADGRTPAVDACEEEVHVLARPRSPAAPALTEKEEEEEAVEGGQALRPEPAMVLAHAVGVTPGWRDLLLAERAEADGGPELVYACHALVVAQALRSGHQRFFVGHTERVTCAALDSPGHLLATGSGPLVRVWRFASTRCLGLARAPAREVRLLSLAPAGDLLVAAGTDAQGRQAVAVWRVTEERGGQTARLSLLARAAVEADVKRLRVLPPALPAGAVPAPGHRFVSVGRNNVRLWRVKEGHLRSSPVDLGEYAGAQLDFTDCAFDAARRWSDADDGPLVFACARSGHIFLVNAARFRVEAVKRLLPTEEALAAGRLGGGPGGDGIGLEALAVAPGGALVATGSRDGFLRLWPADFGHVLLEAEHDAPVTSALVSADARTLLVATASACVGSLDLTSRAYTTLVRAHSAPLVAAAVDPWRRRIATAAAPPDASVRVWDADSRRQLYDYCPRDGAAPTALAFHPGRRAGALAVGFASGALRLFDVARSTLESEQRVLHAAVHALVFAGQRLFACDALGGLALLDAAVPPLRARRVLERAVVRTGAPTPGLLAVDPEGMRLAFAGPTPMAITLADAHSLEALVRVDLALLERQATLDGPIPPPSAPRGLDAAAAAAAARLAFSPNGRHLLVSAGAGGLLLRLSAQDGQLLAARRDAAAATAGAGGGCPLALSPRRGRFLVAGAGAQGLLRVVDAALRPGVRAQRFIGHAAPPACLTFAPDGASLVSAGDALLVWRFLAEPGPPLAGGREEEPQPQPQPQLVPLPDDADAIADSRRSSSPTLEPPPSPPPPLPAAPEPVVRSDPGLTPVVLPTPGAGVHFRPRERAAPMAHRRYLAPPGACGLRLRAGVGCTGPLLWEPAGGLFIYASGRAAVLEEVEGGRQQHLGAGEAEEVSALALSPLGAGPRLLAVAGAARGRPAQLAIWDVARLAEVGAAGAEAALLQCRECHPAGAVQALAFSPCGRLLASLGDWRDAGLLLWDAGDPACWEVLARVSLPAAQHALAWDPDPTRSGQLVTAGADGALLRWQAQPGAEPALRLLAAAPSPEELSEASAGFELTCLAFLPLGAGRWVLVAGASTGRVALWRDGACLLHWVADAAELTALVPAPDAPADGPRLVTAGAVGAVRLWDLAGLGGLPEPGASPSGPPPAVTLIRERRLPARVAAAAGDPPGELCVASSADGGLWLLDWTGDDAPAPLGAALGDGAPPCLDWAPAPALWLGAACADGSVAVLDALRSREEVCRVAVAGARASSIAFAPVGCRLAVGYADGVVRHFHVQRVELLDRWTPLAAAVTALRFVPDAAVLLCGGADGTVAVVAPGAAQPVVRQIGDHRGAPITALDVTGDKWLAASADCRVSVWRADWADDVCELVDWLAFPGPAPGSHPDAMPVPGLARFAAPHDPDLVLFAGAGAEPRIHVYSLAARRVVRSVDLCGHWADCLDVSPRDPVFALGSRYWLTKLVDLFEGSFQDYVQHADGVTSLRFSPDGRALATAAHGEILIWKVRDPAQA